MARCRHRQPSQRARLEVLLLIAQILADLAIAGATDGGDRALEAPETGDGWPARETGFGRLVRGGVALRSRRAFQAERESRISSHGGSLFVGCPAMIHMPSCQVNPWSGYIARQGSLSGVSW